MPTSVLVFGASGLMMGHLLPHLQKHYGFQWTAFVRRGSKGIPFLNTLGVGIIEGSWDDVDHINKLVNQYDIVWDAGDSHDPSLPKILVPALVAGPKRTTYVRFTGTGNWITQTGGNADESARLYDDTKLEDIQSIHADMFNGAGDLLALEALSKGVNVWLLCAGGVYGTPPSGVSSVGVFVRLYTNNALQLGYAPYIGNGDGHMQLIHLDDLVSACDLFLSQVIRSHGETRDTPVAPHERYYLAPGYSVEWKRIAACWSKVLGENLKLDISVKNVAMEEAGFVSPLINADMKAKPTRLENLGWKLRGPSIEDALPAILKEGTVVPLP